MRGTITIAPQTKKGYYTIQTHRGSHSIRLLVGVQNHGHGILLKWSKVVPPYPVVFIIRLPFLRLELASLSIFRHFSRWTSHAAAHHTLQILQHLVSSLCPLHPTSSCTCRIRSEHHLRRVVVLTTCQARCFLPVFATFRMLSEPLSLVRSCFNLRYHMCIGNGHYWRSSQSPYVRNLQVLAGPRWTWSSLHARVPVLWAFCAWYICYGDESLLTLFRSAGS